MSTYVIVANQTLPSPMLWAAVTERARPGTNFHVVVPLTPLVHGLTWDEEESHAQANERLTAFLERLRALGVAAEGEVGDRDPVQAVSDCIRGRSDIDEIVLSTLPPGISRWLGQDVAGRLRNASPIPVAVVYETTQTPVPPRS
jgi:nucleotide-binding universal stress UspA family protein